MRRNGEGIPFELKFLQVAQLKEVEQFQEEIIAYQRQKDQFVPLTNAEFRQVLGEQGISVGAFLEQRLVGFHGVFFPHVSAENLGLDIGLKELELNRVAHMESVSVHPDFRGNGLHLQMANRLIDYIQNHTSYRYLLETVSPENTGSIKNVLKSGLVIVHLKRKYGGLLRYIFYRNLNEVVSIKEDTSVDIDIRDKEKQACFLEKGYIGYRMERKGGSFFISFAKPRKLLCLMKESNHT